MSADPDKKRWPLALAEEVAHELQERLEPFCVQSAVVGSVRRRKPLVGDVEILLMPQYHDVPVDLYGATEPRTECFWAIDALVREGWMGKRRKVDGSVSSWGERNRHAVHAGTGMPVDLFVGRPENWWSLMVCRTGPAALNIEIATQAKGRGLHWDPYRGLIQPGGRVVDLAGEAELFRAVGIAYATPMEREILWGRKAEQH
ncbi:MAG: hypothetical protein KA004_19025 [Verrucomicrobiales bacterium]|nr:hypothetical protein [Verrucomicrobiales bacterium]